MFPPGELGRNSLCQYWRLPELDATTTSPLAAVVGCFVEVGSVGDPVPFAQGTKAAGVNEGAARALSHTSTSLPRTAHTQMRSCCGPRRATGFDAPCATVVTGKADQVPLELRRSNRFCGSVEAVRFDRIAT